MRQTIHSTLAIACVLALGACSSGSKQHEPPPATAAPAKAQRTFSLRGKVVSIDRPGKTVTIDHEAIPGFMDAMAMPYAVKDVHQLDNISPGESITATLTGGAYGYWLEDVRVTKTNAGK